MEPDPHRPCTVEELERWLEDARFALDGYRTRRRRYLQIDSDERRAFCREHAISGLTDLNTYTRIARDNVSRLERAIAELRHQEGIDDSDGRTAGGGTE